MVLLYPRLLAGQAKPLHEEYSTLGLTELAARVTTRHDAAVYVATGGDRIGDDQLRTLRERVLALTREAGFPDVPSRSARAAFDIELAAVLHAEMDLVPAEAASGDIWAFLALALLPDVAYWRYPRPPGDRVLATDLTRHVFGRLWWRAQLVHDPVSDTPYAALDILGEAAFDQIYARRKALGGSPHLVRSILRVWNTLTFGKLRERDVLRDFLKRLLRLAPFVIFEALDDAELDAELTVVATEALAAARADKGLEDRPTGAGASQPPTVIERAQDPGSFPSAPDAGPTLLNVCAGAGGLALGLERAGFTPLMLVDSRPVVCETLRLNRPHWDVRRTDLLDLDPRDSENGADISGVDLLAAGLPRFKGSAATNRARDNSHELEVLRATITFAGAVRPRALLLDNVPHLVRDDAYEPIREYVAEQLDHLGFRHRWFVLNAMDHGVPQDREEGILVAFRGDTLDAFRPPPPSEEPALTAGEALLASMSSRGWPQAERWAAQADKIAPVVVGGSWDRGGGDLGPSGSKDKWFRMGVDGVSLADEPPAPDFRWAPEYGRFGRVQLTVEQLAHLQAFPDEWKIAGRKTARFRQVGNAVPPPVGEALGRAVRTALLEAG